jgi:cell filamentation protein
MSENYTYNDPDYKYTDPQTGRLRNLAGITSSDSLAFFETAATSKRLKELANNPIKIKDSRTLLDIHKYLFQDIYAWAGQTRTVEISKGGRQFFPLDRFGTAFSFIDNLIAEYRQVNSADISALARKLAEILDVVNFLHPFREGNGRTQREFVRVLALEKRFALNLNPADNADVYERYMSGTIDGDIDKLAELIGAALDKRHLSDNSAGDGKSLDEGWQGQ